MRYIIPKSYVWDHYPPKNTKGMGNPLNKLTHFVNTIEIIYASIRRQAFTYYHPPPIRGTYENFFDFEKAKAEHNQRIE